MEDMGVQIRRLAKKEIRLGGEKKPLAVRHIFHYNEEEETEREEEKEVEKYMGISRSQFILAFVCFFVSGIGMTITWNSVLGLIPYFEVYHGKAIQGILITTYNLPSLPVVLVQTQFDQRYDRKYGRKVAYYFRITTAILLLCITAVLFTFQFVVKNLLFLIG
jgi:hypothetical protein